MGDVVDNVDVRDAHGLHDILQHHLVGRGVLEVAAGCGVLLHAGHGRDGVVEDDDDMARGWRVVDHLGDAGEAGVDECRIADDGDDAPGLFWREDLAEAEADGDAAAHADAGVDGGVGGHDAKRVAADVARDDGLAVGEDLVGAAVRAAGAEGRRLAGGRWRLGNVNAVKEAADAADAEFAETVDRGVGLGRDAGEAALLEEDWVAFLDDADCAVLGEGADCRGGEGMNHEDLKQIGRGRGFLRQDGADAGGDDAAAVGLRGGTRERAVALGLGPGADFIELRAKADMCLAGVTGNHDVQ